MKSHYYLNHLILRLAKTVGGTFAIVHQRILPPILLKPIF